jgi:hypothetical protein
MQGNWQARINPRGKRFAPALTWAELAIAAQEDSQPNANAATGIRGRSRAPSRPGSRESARDSSRARGSARAQLGEQAPQRDRADRAPVEAIEHAAREGALELADWLSADRAHHPERADEGHARAMGARQS